MTLHDAPTPTQDCGVRKEYLSVAGTALAVQRRGTGGPLLLIQGGGEDADMLANQAESLAGSGSR